MATNKSQVIVRGFTAHWLKDNFRDMKIYFGGNRTAVPKQNADFIGFYLEAPDSAITHLGIVDQIEEYDSGKTFHLKAIIKLDEPIKVQGYAIRKHEYWSLEQLGVKQLSLVFNDFTKVAT